MQFRVLRVLPALIPQWRNTMRPLFRSYGDISTVTRSPGRMRMKFIRIFPETWARTLWPFSNSTRNMAFGRASVTFACSLIESFFTMNFYERANMGEPRPRPPWPSFVAARSASSNSFRYGSPILVSTSQPLFTTAIVCSKWAEVLPSFVTTVHPLLSVRTA